MIYTMAGFVEGICRSFGERLDTGGGLTIGERAPETRHGLEAAGRGVRFGAMRRGPASRMVDSRANA